MMRTVSKFFLVEKKSIGFLKFIFEAYDGVAVVETMDRRRSLVALHIAPACQRLADQVIAELKKEIPMEPHAEPPETA